MLTIPKRWAEVLSRLHNGGFPEAVIAGGALRDLHNGKPVKDVDIWVRSVVDTDLTEMLVEAAMGYEANDVINLADLTAAGYDNVRGLAMVMDFAHYEPEDPTKSLMCDTVIKLPNFQVMAMDLPYNPDGALSWGYVVTNDFDLGLNRIYWDGVGSVYENGDMAVEPTMTAAYCIDCVTKRMTVLRCRNEHDLVRIKARIERLKQKYPNYTPKNVEVKA
jgi:hypothetical protein